MKISILLLFCLYCSVNADESITFSFDGELNEKTAWDKYMLIENIEYQKRIPDLSVAIKELQLYNTLFDKQVFAVLNRYDKELISMLGMGWSKVKFNMDQFKYDSEKFATFYYDRDKFFHIRSYLVVKTSSILKENLEARKKIIELLKDKNNAGIRADLLSAIRLSAIPNRDAFGHDEGILTGVKEIVQSVLSSKTSSDIDRLAALKLHRVLSENIDIQTLISGYQNLGNYVAKLAYIRNIKYWGDKRTIPFFQKIHGLEGGQVIHIPVYFPDPSVAADPNPTVYALDTIIKMILDKWKRIEQRDKTNIDLKEKQEEGSKPPKPKPAPLKPQPK